jgi:hypothetical protein
MAAVGSENIEGVSVYTRENEAAIGSDEFCCG